METSGKLILPVYFADGSCKTIALERNSTSQQVIDSIVSRIPVAHHLSKTKSNLSSTSGDAASQSATTGLSQNNVASSDGQADLESGWRLLAVRKLRREGQMFSVAELNSSDTIRVLGPNELIGSEYAKEMSSARKSTIMPSNNQNSTSDIRITLVNPDLVVRVHFSGVAELPNDYITSIYVTNSITADTFVDMLIYDYSLKSGYLTGSSSSASHQKNGVKYSLFEVRELFNGTIDTRRLSDKDSIWSYWFESQRLISSGAIKDVYFNFKSEENSWLKKMNSQASKLKDRVIGSTTSQSSVNASSSSLNHCSSSSVLVETSSTSSITSIDEGIKSRFVLGEIKETVAKEELLGLPSVQFDIIFSSLLDDLNIRAADSRQKMMKLDADKKTSLILQQWLQQNNVDTKKTGTTSTSEPTSPATVQSGNSASSFFSFLSKKDASTQDKTPAFYIEKLSNRSLTSKALLKILVSLRVTLSTAKIVWIRDFVANGAGIAALGGVLDRVLAGYKSLSTYSSSHSGNNSSDLDEDIKAECIKSLRILLNTEPGFTNVLKSQLIVTKLTLCIHTLDDRVRMVVAEVLAALCILSEEGHRMVLNAFVDMKGFYSEVKKYKYLVDSIVNDSGVGGFSDSNNPLLAFDYKTAAVSLINALVSVPEKPSERNKIRQEIVSVGFSEKARENLRKDATDPLLTQIDVFDEESRDDMFDLASNQGSAQSLAALDSDMGKVAAENADLKQLVSTLSSRVKELEVKLNDGEPVRSRKGSSVAQADFSKVSAKQLSEELNARVNEVVDLQAELDLKSSELDKLSKVLESTFERIENDQHDWKVKRQNLETTIHNLKIQLDSAERDLENKNADVFKLQAEIANLQIQLVTKNQNAESLQSGIEMDLRSKLQTSQQHYDKVKKELDEFLRKQEQQKQLLKDILNQTEVSSDLQAVISELAESKTLLSNANEQVTLFKTMFPEGAEQHLQTFTDLRNNHEQALIREKQHLETIERLKSKPNEAHETSVTVNPSIPLPPPFPAPTVSPSPPLSVVTTGAPPPPPPPPGIPGAPPPPPAPGIPGAPAPPPPPPGVPAPPRPPGPMKPTEPALPPGIIAKPQIKPPVPMKNLYWTKIAIDSIPTTLWRDIKNEHELLKTLNKDELVSLFSKQSAPVSNKRASSSNMIQKAISTSLLDNNRAQQVSIVLARIKLSFEDIKSAFLSLHDEKLSTDQVKSLQQFSPTDEESEMLSEYVISKLAEKGSMDAVLQSLGNAERYFYTVSSVPRLPQRLNCWLFKRRFESELRDCRVDMEIVVLAVQEVKASIKLKRLLRLILALGNFLNGGSARGQAFGVQLDVFSKMKDMKSNQTSGGSQEDKSSTKTGVTSLLHFIVKQTRDEGYINFIEDMPHLESACRVSLQSLRQQVRALKIGADQIPNEIKALESNSIEGDRFTEVMSRFHESISGTVSDMQTTFEELERNAKGLVTYFGEDPVQKPLEEFLASFLQCNNLLTQCQRELDEAERIRNQPVASVPLVAVASKQKPTQPGVTMEKGDLENAIRQLKTGTLRKTRRLSRADN